MSTATVTTCPRCDSYAIRHQGAEWRCTSCLAKSPGYSARTLDDPVPFDQRPDHTAPVVVEPVRDPWAAAKARADELGSPSATSSTSDLDDMDAERAANPLLEPAPASVDDAVGERLDRAIDEMVVDGTLAKKPPRQDYELIGDLVWWTREHHDALPLEDDWARSAPFGADPVSVYIERFGSWDAALAELQRSLLPDDDAATQPAGPLAQPAEPATPVERSRQSRYTDEQLLGHLHAHFDKHGRAPSATRWKHDRPIEAPSATTYIRRFGSWRDALAAAGLQPNKSGRSKTSQPAPAKATVTLAAAAEKPAAPPPPPQPAVGVPAREDSDAPSLAPETPAHGVVEAPPAIPIHGFDVDTTDLVVTRTQTAWLVDDARDELQLRYARSLLATLDSTEVDDGAGCDFFWQLCDRIERVIGLQEAS